jgi:hypothetical protein
MASSDDIANKVVNAVQNKPEAVKAIGDALATGDADKIQHALSHHAGIDISAAEAHEIATKVKADPSQAAAYCT